MKWFNVVHHDGSIQVRIDDGGFTTIDVNGINDVAIVVQAINRAFREGAQRGTLFTGDVVNEDLARMHRMRAERGTSWLGGNVTRLADGSLGACFRIDWQTFPQITE
jgi:hypothetical protein